MASLFAKNAMRICPKALPTRTAFSSKLTGCSSKQWAAPSVRCFSQSLPRLEKRFTESHEWVDLSANGKTYKVGITNHAAEALGDIVFVEVPEVGDEVTSGEAFGSVESVKSASDLVSPISGTVVAANSQIVEKPSDLSSDPEGEGWLVEVEPTDVSAVESLMDAAAYAEFVKDH
ncbi:glycine cleavage system H [Paramyrothecium foliicola]|nr:glycine cleavage system H [Paramyrothecium foliicola]